MRSRRPGQARLLLGVPVVAAGALVGLCLGGPPAAPPSVAGLHPGRSRSATPALSTPALSTPALSTPALPALARASAGEAAPSSSGADAGRRAEPTVHEHVAAGERCCGTGASEASEPPEPSAEVGAAALSGTVLAPTGRPLASARVEVRAADGALRAVGQSGPDGAFLVEGVLPGEVVVVARCTGWLEGASRPVTLVAGDALDVGALWLSEGATLAGRVLDADGRPVAGARVELNGERHVVTDEEGAFEATGLAPGAVTLVARAAGALPSDPLGLALGPAGARGLTLTLRAQPVLRGLVRGPDGQPLAGASVARLGDLDAAVRTGADGRFALPGEREGEPLLVTAPGLAAARVDAGAEVTLRAVAPAPGATPRVLLRRGDAPAAGVTLLVAPAGTQELSVVTSDAAGVVWLTDGPLDLALLDASTAHARLSVRSLAADEAAATWELPAAR